MEDRVPRRQGGQNPHGFYKALGRAFAAMVMSLLISGTPLVSTITKAAGSVDAGPLDNFLPGEVTAHQEKENVLQINNEDYSIREDVLITDDKMRPMTLKDLVPGTQVMFHLKKGRIDQIVILRPS
ncbi:MAG: hypothetical protein C4293_04030 [Nitrospiraceae bacterium]